jgi:hypothetical protein
MNGAHRKRPGYVARLGGKVERILYEARRRRGKLGAPRIGNDARIGIYVAYYDASWIFEHHLQRIRDLTVGRFNYYVMGNCTTASEASQFDANVRRFGFPIPFYPWPRSIPLSHGESLQRMIEATRDEIIVLMDIDAFPLRAGWDSYVVSELRKKDVVAAVVDMPHRRMPVFLHPCFMAFRRKLLVENGLNVLPSGENDPAWRITDYLQQHGRLTPDHVTPLYPTRREIDVYPRGSNEFFGRRDLVHGFGTTYADMVFHFWFARYISNHAPVLDGNGKVILSETDIEKVIERTLPSSRGRPEEIADGLAHV